MMSAITQSLTAKEQARFLEAARVAALWFFHNQNAPGQAWGGVDQSADLGRYLYEYFPATGQCRGTGVWSQGLATCLLQSVSAVTDLEAGRTFAKAAEMGASYLMSLQNLDRRSERACGGFREHNPQVSLWIVKAEPCQLPARRLEGLGSEVRVFARRAVVPNDVMRAAMGPDEVEGLVEAAQIGWRVGRAVSLEHLGHVVNDLGSQPRV